MELVISMRKVWKWAFVDEFCWLRAGVPKAVVRRFKNGFEPIFQFCHSVEKFKFRPQSVMHPSDSIPTPGGEGIGDTNSAGNQGKGKRYGGTASESQGFTGRIFGTNETHTGMAYPSNVLKAISNMESLGHEAAFPPGLPGFFMRAYSDDGDIWLDPFLGSGSTMVAAEQLDRVCYGMEIEPKYVAVCLQRMADMGLKPKRIKA